MRKALPRNTSKRDKRSQIHVELKIGSCPSRHEDRPSCSAHSGVSCPPSCPTCVSRTALSTMSVRKRVGRCGACGICLDDCVHLCTARCRAMFGSWCPLVVPWERIGSVLVQVAHKARARHCRMVVVWLLGPLSRLSSYRYGGLFCAGLVALAAARAWPARPMSATRNCIFVSGLRCRSGPSGCCREGSSIIQNEGTTVCLLSQSLHRSSPRPPFTSYINIAPEGKPDD